MMTIALAVDAGYGVIKYTHRNEGKTGFASFPSVALPADARPDLPVENGMGSRRVVLVEYDNSTYCVGPDVAYEMGEGDLGRDLTRTYYHSPLYHALMRGALSFMGETSIDVLVLGLPMDRFNFPQLIKELEQHYTGRVDLGFGKTVEIHRTIVHPQPFGGYIGLGHYIRLINKALANYPQAQIEKLEKAQDLQNLNVLVVDSGSYTLDWLFMSPTGPMRAASGAANNAGRFSVIRKLYDMLSAELGQKPPMSLFFKIDEAERTGKPIRISGRVFDLKEERFQNAIKKTVDNNIQHMLEHIGGNIDLVDLIAVVGGEPKHVANAIQKRLPDIPLFVAPVSGDIPSIYTNLCGFQEYAEAIAKETKR